MTRRLAAAVAVIALLLTPAQSRVSPVPIGGTFVATPVSISATSLTPTFTLPTDFYGLSFDKGSGGLLSGYFTPANTSLISLLSLLGPTGNLRIGGNSSDTTPSSSITQAMILNLYQFLRAIGPGWTLIYGLNSVSGDTAGAIAEVGYCESAFGSGNVIYQIGNEPDGPHWAGNESGYIAQWQTYYAAIHAAYPAARFAGPDIANAYISGLGWIPAFVSAVGSNVVEITQHYYTGPSTAGVPSVFPDGLLLNAVKGLQIRSVEQPALASPLPARLTETNTEEPGGIDGVSNSAVSAPWAVLETIILAQAGWVGVNVHGGPTGNFYAPYSLNGSIWAPTPIFAGMVLASKVNGAGVLPTDVEGGGSTVWGLGLLSIQGKTQFLIVNVDTTNAWPVLVTQSGSWTQQLVLMETAAQASATITTLGGAQIGASGAWSGSSTVVLRGNQIVLPPASAALVTLQ